MGKMKDLLIELTSEAEVTKNVTECPVVATFMHLDAKDFMRDKGNFVPLWHAAKVANARIDIIRTLYVTLKHENGHLKDEIARLEHIIATSGAT